MSDEDRTGRSVRELSGYVIGATDGDIGRVRDVYFRDRRWRIRYLVVDTSHWLTGRRVLISPLSLCGADHTRKILRSTLTKMQVAHSPDIDTDKPVSRQHEIELFQYYLPSYWSASRWTISPYAMSGLPMATLGPALDDVQPRHGDQHLRSAHAVIHYYVHAVDGDMGHVHDFLYDDATWTITHLVVGVGPFGAGRKVVVPAGCITGVSWEAGTVDVALTGAEIRLAPELDRARRPHRPRRNSQQHSEIV